MNDNEYLQRNLRTHTGECQGCVSLISPRVLAMVLANQCGICSWQKTGVRNVFLENGLVVFVTYYHKGYSISGSTKTIHRYLPREIDELLVYYLWLIVPFRERIALKIFRKPISESLFEYLQRTTSSKTQKITSNRFRAIFRRGTLAGLGLAVNPSNYRHIAIGVSRRFLRKSLAFQPDPEDREDEEDESEYEEDILDIQAAHSSRVSRLTYARSLFEAKGEVRSTRERFRKASLASYIIFSLSTVIL